MDYIYAKLNNALVDINRIDEITLNKCEEEGIPLKSLKVGDYYLKVTVVDSDKVSYCDLSDLTADNNALNEKLEKEISDRILAVKSEEERTNNMIDQLNQNVHSQLTQLNQILIDSINTINGGIEEERKIRAEADTTLQSNLNKESQRVDNMINQVNENIKVIVNQLNQNLVDAINTINGGIEEERQTRATADETLQSNIDTESNERKSVDQHLWGILPDNIIAGTPMQGMENKNAVNIVFSKYQKHGIGEDPAGAEYVEMPNQAITLFPATQEVAGVLTAADKTKIDNIATDIETAVQAESEARQEADTTLENKLDSLIVVEGDAIQVGREDKELNIKTGGRFTVNSNYEVVTSEEYPGEHGRRIIPLENNDQIAGKKTDGNGVPLIFVSKWDKVEVGGSGAPLNLNSNDGKVTVNDKCKLLDDTDKQELETYISEEITARTQADTQLGNRITAIEDTGVLNSQFTGKGKLAIDVQSEAGRTFNIEAVDTSDAGNDDRFTLTLDNNDSISGKKLDNTSVPLVFMSKWDKVEVGGSSAPLNLNSNDGKVTVNDTYTLLDNNDKESINTSIDDLSTRIGNLEGKTTRLYYGEGTLSSPTATEIQSFITNLEVDPPYEPPYSGIAVVVKLTDENTYHIWHYYANLNAWKDDGVDLVNTFTNDFKGIIQGTTSVGYISAEKGFGKVNG